MPEGFIVPNETGKPIDHRYTDEIVCPWCGAEMCDPQDYFTHRTDTEIDCDCGKRFSASANYSVTYCTAKIEPTG